MLSLFAPCSYLRSNCVLGYVCMLLLQVLSVQSTFTKEGGALAGLVHLSNSDIPLIRELCAHALFNLSFDAKAKEDVVAAGVRERPHCHRLLRACAASA